MVEKKTILGYENYEIYSDGRLYNTKTKRFLKGKVSPAGYLIYTLSKNNKKTYKRAHRLVAEAFLSNNDNLPDVNHIDGNKLNNDVSNLEWCTRSQNMRHAYETKLIANTSQTEYYTTDLDQEAWKQYKDTFYYFSSCGRVKNILTNQILKPVLSCGYNKVILSLENGLKDILIHKMVYALFNDEEYLENNNFIIAHKDGNKINNNINNLVKRTRSEHTMSVYYDRENKPINIKTVLCYTKNGDFICEYPSCAEAARQLKLDRSSISKCCRGVIKQTGGYIFKYKE